MSGNRLLSKVRPGWQETCFYVRAQQGYLELCLGMDDEPAERLRGELASRQMSNFLVGVCYRPTNQE